MILYTVTWELHGQTYSEKRAHDKPEALQRHMESLACREWPIANVAVKPPPKKGEPGF